MTDLSGQIRAALGLSRSIVLSGDRWSEQAQETWDAGLAALAALEAELDTALTELVDLRARKTPLNGWLGHENMKRERDEARAALVAFTESKTVCSVAPSLVRAARAALGEPAE